MARKSAHEPKVYLVIWKDAISADAWDLVERELPLPLVMTVGWFVKQDDEKIVLLSSVSDPTEEGEKATGFAKLSIPIGMVEQVYELAVTRKKKKVNK